MTKSLEAKFKDLKRLLDSSSFLENQGLGNEVGYYIFDYDPKDELKVRDFEYKLVSQKTKSNNDYVLCQFNLYKIMMNYIEENNYLDLIACWEKEHDIAFVATRINRLLRMEEFDDSKMYFNEYIKNYIYKKINGKAVVMLTGIGEIYPIVRAHTILNKMHLVLDDYPVIMMYPGRYDNSRLTILNTNKDINYYRAFRI